MTSKDETAYDDNCISYDHRHPYHSTMSMRIAYDASMRIAYDASMRIAPYDMIMIINDDDNWRI